MSKWHPEPNVLECEHCGAKFYDGGKMVEGFGPVKMPAVLYKQIHDMAYSYDGQVNMCGLDEKDGKAAMARAPLPTLEESHG